MKEQRVDARAAQASAVPSAPNPRFRAEADDLGRWFVWQRFGQSGWAACRACRSRSDAVNLAAAMNQSPAAAPAN
ncbi:MAG: hypothetical protein RIB60_04595 [Phycisphaerales bacterium]